MAMGKNPHVVGIETLKKNGINVDDLIKELVANASVEFTAYYYFTLLRANCTGMEGKESRV
jgi:ferritin-like protein